MTTIHRLTRRKLLGRAGVTLTLPLLDAMVPLQAQARDAGKRPRRMERSADSSWRSKILPVDGP